MVIGGGEREGNGLWGFVFIARRDCKNVDGFICLVFALIWERVPSSG